MDVRDKPENDGFFLSSFLRHNEVSRASEVQGGCGAVLLMSGFCGCFKNLREDAVEQLLPKVKHNFYFNFCS